MTPLGTLVIVCVSIVLIVLLVPVWPSPPTPGTADWPGTAALRG